MEVIVEELKRGHFPNVLSKTKAFREKHETNGKSIDDLILYGDLAFMCDYKLARRIMSDAVKQIENVKAYDQQKAAHAYLVLGEAEGN
ncbi:hypothetical protein [Oceanobacillus rekensis]|uniref:hypothetical protein n=1 Tax=Oceanobacillus rekensis TaxID=937927 RepID=UPI000B42D9EE|nr:hypothetical protein [Oceanobacillus rekensis]